MQTRSQTRNLLLAQALEKAPTKVLESTKVLAKVLESTKVLETRILPDTIKNVFYESEHTLYMPQYLQKPLYDVDIDFDEASEAWRSNKISIGNGQYKYKKRVKF
jgi:hypothetical protein